MTESKSANNDSANNSLALKDLCRNNLDFFANDNSENGQRLSASFLSITDSLESLNEVREKVESVAANYDFDENVPANGYRSFLKLLDYAIVHTLKISRKICMKRDGVLFRKAVITKEIESCAQLLDSLGNCLTLLLTIVEWCDKNELFPREKHRPNEIIVRTKNINRYCFYGRSLGFQFCESIRPTLQFVALAMAVFSEAYYSKGSFIAKAKSSVTSAALYLSDPEERARTIVNVSETASIDFCKSFWFLSESELMNNMPAIIRQNNVKVTKVIHIPPEPLTLNINGQDVEVPIPESHIGRKPIQVRLISSAVREGMIGEANQKSNLLPPSNELLFHCHGGGFVAQSSKSHEVYLKVWAKELNVPILSVDYSLAPQAPYPRALEEVTYAYCWAIKNCHLLGCTGETIVAAGDSAGANLLLGTSLKCTELNIKPPHGLFLAYVPTFVNFVPSPSRLLCLMDPLLPFGFMMRCLKAYAGAEKDTNNGSDLSSFEEISHSDFTDLQAHKSPTSEISDTLSNESFESQYVKDLITTMDLLPEAIELDENLVEKGNGMEASTSKEKENLDQDSLKNSYSFIQRSLTGFVNNLKEHIGNWIPGVKNSSSAESFNVEKERNIVDEFNFDIPEDPYISPYLANDELLKTLPNMKILTVEMDPCLDDCIMFAKKMKRLNHNITLDVLQGLPHGFLNFCMFSKEANKGTKLSAQRIRELFNLKGK